MMLASTVVGLKFLFLLLLFGVVLGFFLKLRGAKDLFKNADRNKNRK